MDIGKIIELDNVIELESKRIYLEMKEKSKTFEELKILIFKFYSDYVCNRKYRRHEELLKCFYSKLSNFYNEDIKRKTIN